MEDVSYKPLIEGMTWSFSRIKAFEDCPYRWYLSYIRNRREEDRFYASYGSFMHGLLADFYTGRTGREGMLMSFLAGFREKVKGERPRPDTLRRYIESGAEYIRTFRPLEMEILGVEKKVDFEVDGIPFTGYIDLLGRTDDGIVVVDHKSRALKPRNPFSVRVTQADAVREEMMKQLYLYSAAVQEEYGELPAVLAFNCFRNGVLIEEPFSEERFESAKRWAADTVRSIENTGSFPADPDYFKCRNVCGVSRFCPYFGTDGEGE